MNTIYEDILKDITLVNVNDIERYFINDCRNGNLEGVKILYNSYHYLNETIEKGYEEACLNGQLDIIKFIESIYLVYKRNFSWYVGNACLSGDIDTVKHLLGNVDKIKLEIDNQLALRFACKRGNSEIVDLILTRDCNPIDYSSLEYSIPHPEIYHKLRDKIPPHYKDLFTNVYYQYACVYNLEDQIKDIIENLEIPITDDIIKITLSKGNIRVIKYLLNKINFEQGDVDNYLRIVFNRKDLEIVQQFYDYIRSKHPHGFIHYKRLMYMACNLNYIEGMKWILENSKDDIGMENIFEYCYNRENREDMLRYLIYGNYIDRSYVIFSLLTMGYIYNKSFTRELLIYFDMTQANHYLHTYLLKFSHKKDILKRIFVKDLYSYLTLF